ncbi:hypothetical protein EJD97_017098 [Solanum chilense]|uniref:Uncharacterized protein n=1 Tax=Solanum chilense TaxID=4083 RepID=A0A6N2CCJ6_SOLCI|nr:hypothetical protein EJD97_017098 [Solanum chilense]
MALPLQWDKFSRSGIGVNKLVNSRFNSARIIALVDSSIEEPAIRVHGRGRGRGKAKGRVHGRVAPAIDEVSIEDVLVNENPTRNMKRWKRMRILRRAWLVPKFFVLTKQLKISLIPLVVNIAPRLLALKPLVFLTSETKDAYEFILDCYERLYELGIVHQYGIEFVSFQLKEKYVTRTLRDLKKDEFMALEKGGMSEAAYEAKFLGLLRHSVQLVTIE